ncbi:MAG: glycosyltransferase family 2 protein, partial [Candidatus Eiseniibacteriota bacterium]
GLIVYPYVGYPLLLRLARLLGERPVARAPWTPEVTLIITAYNAAQTIRAKLENALALDYPADRLHVIVASDCSDDGTDAIVGEFAGRGVELVALPERQGKVAAQNAAIERARGEILVFSDARIMLNPESIRAMMENFADPGVGCVSSTDRVLGENGTSGDGGEGLYVRYEMWLRDEEARRGTLIGASGSFYAVRRALAARWEPALTRDFLTPLKVIEAGYRTVPEPRAIGTYRALTAPEAEFRRKVRTVMRGMAVLWSMRVLLDPIRHPGAAFRLWSHKVLRWTVPFFLLLLLVASLVLAAHSRFHAAALVAQLVFYALALAGYLHRGLEVFPFVKIPLFFTNVNLSILSAWFRFLAGGRQVTWEPTQR